MVIRNRSIISCFWEANFGSLLGPEFEEETVHEVVISQNENFLDPCHGVPICAPVSLCDQFKCKYVCFLLKAEEENRPVPSRTVDTVLMEASRARVIPDHAEAAEGRTLRGDQRLRNDILGKILK